MASIILRQASVIPSPEATIKGTPLTNSEVDNNFANLNVQVSDLSNTVSTLVTSEISNGSSNISIPTSGGNALVSTHIVPFTNGIYDLGNTTTRFSNLFLTSNLFLSTANVSGDSTGNVFVNGVLAFFKEGNVIVKDGTITESKIASGAVTSSKIATGAVGADQIAATGVTAAQYGTATSVSKITVDADGRITAAENQDILLTASQITDGAISSAKLENSGVTAATYGSTTNIPVVVVNAKGQITAAANATFTIAAGSIGATELASTGVSAATYGSSSTIPVLTIDSDGRITSATTAAASSGTTVTLSDDTSSSSTHYLTLSTSTGGTVSLLNVSSTKLYFVPSTGTLSATEFNSLSDAMFKEDINYITSPLSIIEKLSGVEFTWIDSKKKSSGVVAQDVEKVLSHLVTQNNEGHKSVNYDGLIAYLIESVKELSDKVKKLENK